MYIKRNLSTWKIEKILGYSRGTIYRKLKEFNIKTRDISESHLRYDRISFNKNPFEKAYLIGFAIGDLRIRRVGKKSMTIKADCKSTKIEQIRLIHNLFKKYGRVWIGKKDKEGKIQIEAFLDTSFSFLLNLKKELKPILKNKKLFPSFLAGFIDAEGSFFISKGMANFSLGNYNSALLKNINKKFQYYKIYSHLHKDRKLYKSKEGYKRSNYYWHLTIQKKDSLIRLGNLIAHLLKHEKRKTDLEKILNNIQQRNLKSKVIKS